MKYALPLLKNFESSVLVATMKILTSMTNAQSCLIIGQGRFFSISRVMMSTERWYAAKILDGQKCWRALNTNVLTLSIRWKMSLVFAGNGKEVIEPYCEILRVVEIMVTTACPSMPVIHITEGWLKFRQMCIWWHMFHRQVSCKFNQMETPSIEIKIIEETAVSQYYQENRIV